MTTEPLMPEQNEASADAGPHRAAAADDLSATPFWRQLVAYPYEADLFAILRWIDSRAKNAPLLGRAARPQFEPVRLGQEPSLTFAASTIAGIGEETDGKPPRLHIYSFGLFGPNGPLPLHMTEYARDRLRRFNDATLVHFADIFHHRLILLFYRAWADVQPSASMDRIDTDRFTNYLASLIGYGQPAMQKRDAVADHAKLANAAHFVRQTRNPEGLAKILARYLEVPVAIDEFVANWIPLLRSEQTRLSPRKGNNRLGEDTVLGERVLDAQHKIRVRLGPMPLSRYRELLPCESLIGHIAVWIRNYCGIEFSVDLQMLLHKEEVPQTALGAANRLGWTSWLGEYKKNTDADDLTLHCAL